MKRVFTYRIGNFGIRVKNPDEVRRIANRTYVIVGDKALVIADRSFSIMDRNFVEQFPDYRVAKPVY